MHDKIKYVIFMNEKQYYSLDKFYKEKFGTKVFKVSLDAGFTCPNKDGSKNIGGCIFCNGSTGVGNKKDSLQTQFEYVKNNSTEAGEYYSLLGFLNHFCFVLFFFTFCLTFFFPIFY